MRRKRAGGSAQRRRRAALVRTKRVRGDVCTTRGAGDAVRAPLTHDDDGRAPKSKIKRGDGDAVRAALTHDGDGRAPKNQET